MKDKNQFLSKVNKIDENLSIEMKATDLAFIYRAVESFIDFFHQPNHYTTIEQVKDFIGNKDIGGYSDLNYIYYHILDNAIPEEIKNIIED